MHEINLSEKSLDFFELKALEADALNEPDKCWNLLSIDAKLEILRLAKEGLTAELNTAEIQMTHPFARRGG